MRLMALAYVGLGPLTHSLLCLTSWGSWSSSLLVKAQELSGSGVCHQQEGASVYVIPPPPDNVHVQYTRTLICRTLTVRW